MFITDRRRAYRDTDVHYLWAGVTQFFAFQGLNWPNSSRQSEVQGYQDIIQVNPLIGLWYHDTNFMACNGFQPKSNLTNGIPYNYVYQNRADGIAYLDANNPEDLCGKNGPASGTGTAEFFGNPLDSGYREYMANIAADVILGTNKANRGINGPNLVNNVAYFNDAMPWVQPRPGAKYQRPLANGSITDVVETRSSPNQIRVIELDSQPNPPTSGTVTSPGSRVFNAVSQANVLLFCTPQNINSNGIVGHEVLGYRNVSGGRSEVYVDDWPSEADFTQPYQPSAGDRWCLSNPSNLSNNLDWDADGSGDGQDTQGHDNWATAYNQFWDTLEQKVFDDTGIVTGRGFNSITGTFNEKDSGGLPENIVQREAFDVVNAENGDSPSGFSARFTSESHDYATNNVDMTRQMRHMYLGVTYIRDGSSNSFPRRMRGVAFEARQWGNTYNDINDLDASYLRFWLVLCLLVPKTFMVTTGRQRTAFPCHIEENWIDFDTNYSTPAAIGTYQENENNGEGIFTWATPDNGERIFVRRLGNWLVAINAADPPANYPNDYAPSHLGGYTPRDPEDQISPSTFSNYLSGGETISHFNPATYINPVMTAEVGYDWGPRQAHPRDNNGTGNHGETLSNASWIARDNTLNDGSSVNTSVAYGLGPLEAVVWEIS